MRITVFGATGAIGRRVVAEATSRGHAVTAVVRDPSRYQGDPARPTKSGDAPSIVTTGPSSHALPTVTVEAGDASDVADVVRLTRGQDLAISATRPAPGNENDLVTTAKALLAGVAATGVRLLLVGGAADLVVPGTGGLPLVETPDFPPSLRPIALACQAQHGACRADDRAAWTYASPPMLIEPGERTGRFRLGGDELLMDPAGNSAISMEDFAVALLDEAEHPRHHRSRFTAAY